jgi:hypothetical protein
MRVDKTNKNINRSKCEPMAKLPRGQCEACSTYRFVKIDKLKWIVYILFCFLYLFLNLDAFAIVAKFRSTILTMHESSGSFIPKAPDVPKVDPKIFESSDLTGLKKSASMKIANSNKNLTKNDGDLALPDAWFFSIGFKSKSDPDFISYFKQLKKVKIPVFKLYCKHEKNPVQLHIGPYFDKYPKAVMHSIIKKIDDLALKKWLVKNMLVESFEPASCEFIS